MNVSLLLFIAVALSMDTFSLSLSLGTFNISKKTIYLFSCLVGLFHFIMPILGNILGSKIKNIIYINEDKILGIIFLFILIEMIIDLFSKKSKEYDLNIFNMILYAFSVSIDSFSIGIGLNNITTSVTAASTIFCLISFLFTSTGLFIGKFSYHKLGNLSKIIGIIIIFILTFFQFY